MYKPKRHLLSLGIAALLAFLLVGFLAFYPNNTANAAAGINHQINFQGKLVNNDGTNVTDGSYSVVFSIYSVSSGGSAIWTESDTVTVTSGIFQVNLGAVTTLPGSIDFNTDNIYLGIKVGTDAEMTPRIQFTAVPQAFNSEKLNGLASSAFGQLAANQTWSGTNLFQPAVSATALQVDNASNPVLTVDTSGNNVIIGKAGAQTATLEFANATGTNVVGIVAGASTAAYTLTLPTVAPSTNQCLESGSGTATLLQFGSCTTLTANNGLTITSNVVGLGGSLNTGTTTITGTATSQLQVSSGANVPSVDQLNITNTGSSGVATAGINGLKINYKGGAAAVEASAEEIDLQPGTTTGGTWSAVRNVANVTGPATGVTENGEKFEGPATTGGAGVYNAINIANIGVVASGGTVRGINITATNSNSAGTVRGIQLNNLTAGAASETGIDLGTGWDNLVTYNNGATVLINGTGQFNGAQLQSATVASGALANTTVTAASYGSASSVATFTVNAEGQLTAAASTSIAIAASQVTSGQLAVAQGGTGIGSYTAGDLLYASASTTFTAIHITGTSGQCLTSNGSVPAWGTCVTGANNGLTLASGTVSLGGTLNSGTTTITGAAGSQLQISSGASVPTVDQLNITNTGSSGVTTAGINGFSLQYKGGAAAVEAAAQRIDLQPGTTTGGTWSGLRNVANVTGPATGVTENGAKFEGPATTGGAGVYNAINVANIGVVASGGTVRGINIAATNSNAAGTVRGLELNNLTAGAASEIGIDLGTGWDNLLTYNNGATVLINGTGQFNGAQLQSATVASAALANTTVTAASYGSASSVATFTVNAEGQLTAAASTAIAIAASQVTSGQLAVAQGGTGIGSYTAGDLLYASAATTFTQIHITGTSGECLTSNGSVPSWGTCISSANNGLTITTGAVGLGGTLNTGTTTITGTASSQLQISSGANVPTVDQLNITNTGSSGVATAGINGFSLQYKGGAAAVESAAQRIDLQPGTTTGGTWSGLRNVANVTGPATGVTENGEKFEGPATTGGAGVYNAINVANIGAVASGGVVRGINITATNSNAAGTVRGLELNNLTAGAASEIGIDLGTGWDNLLTYNNGATILINGTGQFNGAQLQSATVASAALANTTVTAASYGSASSVATFTVNAEGQLTAAASTSIAIAASQVTSGQLAVAQGGTGIGSYTAGDLLYASASTTFTAIHIAGTSGECLTSNGSIPSWNTCSAITANNGLTLASGNVALGGTLNNSTTTLTSGGTSSNITLTSSASFVPAVTQFTITNAAAGGVTTTGVYGLNVNYKGGAAAVTGGAELINLQEGTTSGGTWNGLEVAPNATGAVTGVTENGVSIDNLTTPGAGTENAINVGTGWDNVLQATNVTITQGGGATFAGNVAVNGGLEATSSSTGTVPLTVQGSNAGFDAATLSSEINTTGTFGAATGWGSISGTGTSATATATNSSSNMTFTLPSSLTSGNYYQLVFSLNSFAGGGVSASAGGHSTVNLTASQTNYTEVFKASATSATITFVPFSFFGTITSISVKQVTLAAANLTVNSSNGSAALEVRTGGPLSSGNTFVGLQAGQTNTGIFNAAFGAQTFQANTSGSFNAAFGYQTLQLNSTGNDNTAFGTRALQSNTIGGNNTAVGEQALNANIISSNSTAVGYNALNFSTGTANTAVGAFALSTSTTGFENTALGESALSSNTTGSLNLALGYNTGSTDSNNKFSTLSNLQGAASIGAFAQVQTSNAIVLGSVDIATKVGIGTTIPLNTFSVSPVDLNSTSITASQTSGSGTITASGSIFSASNVGEEFIWADGTQETITAFTDATHVTGSSTSITEASKFFRTHHIGLQVTSTGTAYIQQTSTTAFQVQNTAGTTVLGIDTSANLINVSNGADLAVTASPTSTTISVNSFSTGLSTASSNLQSMVVNSSGAPIFATTGVSSGGHVGFKLFICSDSQCSSQTTVSFFSSAGVNSEGLGIVLDSSGFPVIAFGSTVSGGGSGSTLVVHCSNATCSSSTSNNIAVSGITTTMMGNPSGLALNASGFPEFPTWGGFVVCSNAACSADTVTTNAAISNGGFSSMHINSSGNPVLDFSGTMITCTTANCSASTNVSTGFGFNDFAFNSSGNPVYIFNGTITTCTTATCSSSTSVTNSNLTSYTPEQIFLDSNGYPTAISGNKYAHCTDAACAGNVFTRTISSSITGSRSTIMPFNGLPVLTGQSSNGQTEYEESCGNLNCDPIVYSGGSDIGSVTNYFNNVYAATYYGKNASLDGFDLAEEYRVHDSNIQAGDIVMLSPNQDGGPTGQTSTSPYVDKTTSPYQAGAIGVVSTNPGITLTDGNKSGNERPVALSGRVPVNVNTTNGDIAIGDPITASAIPGVGMKAVQAGQIIGYAAEAYSGDGTGQILVFINPGYWTATGNQDLQANNAILNALTVNGALNAASINIGGMATIQDLEVLGDATIDGNLTVIGLTSVMDIIVNGHIITAGSTPQVVITSNAGQNATVSIAGNDTSGTITITTGDVADPANNVAGPSIGDLATLMFAKQYSGTPHIIITANDAKSSAMQVYPDQQGTSGFAIALNQSPSPNTTYTFEYFIVQ